MSFMIEKITQYFRDAVVSQKTQQIEIDKTQKRFLLIQYRMVKLILNPVNVSFEAMQRNAFSIG
jgi:hypothetical protein